VNFFTQRVIKTVSRIPKGEVLTYKHVAQKSGSPNAARAVGMILKRNTNTDILCHRVICSNGTMGGYNMLRGKSKKEFEKFIMY
jgi:O-6-methylguanine DNA methyltransferase